MSLDLALRIALSMSGFLIVFIAHKIDKSLDTLSRSVQNLNVNLAVVVEKVDSHEGRINKLEKIRRIT